MDYTSVFGLLVAIVAVVGGQLAEGGRAGSLMQGAAFMIVIGGTFGAAMVQTPMRVFVEAIRMGRWAIFPPHFDGQAIISRIENLAHAARKDGVLALEALITKQDDPFTRRGLQMLVDGFDADSLNAALEVELNAYEEARRNAARVWEAAGGYSPTMGILGAVLGLIHVMENLADPTRLGAGIAVAFVATVYGVGLANVILLPVAGKLKAIISREVLAREMVQDGLLGIANGENPRVIATRLGGYLYGAP